MSDFPHIRAAVFSVPWAIQPERLEAIVEVLTHRLQGFRRTPEEIAAIKGERVIVNGGIELRSLSDPTAPLAAAGSSNQPAGLIAVINIAGIIAQHANQVDDISGPGGTSTERVSRAFQTALADPAVKAIVLNIDSPGGSVSGVQALADEIYKARGRKPIVAQVNSLAASAAYWIAAAADEIVVTPGGQVGSIGVYATHTDVSAEAEKKGVKVTFISAGKYKVEGNPFEALGDEASGAMQKMVNSYYADFTNAVARGRGVSIDDVRGGFGEGRVVKDKEAVRERMADRVDTLSATLNRLASGQKTSQKARAASKSVQHASIVSPTIRVETAEDGTRAHFVESEWPEKISISTQILDDGAAILAYDNEKNQVTFTLANAVAVYQIDGFEEMTDTFQCSLIEGIFEPAASKDSQTPEDRDAFRRRRHALRMRRFT